ncbi:MAG: polyamine aminopropyltransferase [Pseudomonadota bacterium]
MTDRPDRGGAWLLAATFLVAIAGLVYELIAGTVASYLLGDSVTQFSLVIGLFMTAMGLGAWLSRFVDVPEQGFVWSQTGLGLVGGFSAPVLFLAFAYVGNLQVILFAVVVAVGVLAGLEIPLITRMLNERDSLKHIVSSVLAVDYAGALVAAVLFPLLIVPQLGLMPASLAFGVLNLLVAGMTIWLFRATLGPVIKAVWFVGLVALVAGLFGSQRIVAFSDAALFEDEVILSEDTAYQRIVVTRFKERYRLFLNGAIQFDTLDEYRYHESLVHPAMASAGSISRVLVLGGGDGMAVREVLRWAGVDRVTLVDLDPRVTELFRSRPQLVALNEGALSDPAVRIVNADAWTFAVDDDQIYDVIILDLPDPRTVGLSKLYSREFYARLAERTRDNTVWVTQAGSPVFAREAFWSIERTLAGARNPFEPDEGMATVPYHAYVPSFGDWGFVIAAPGGTPRWRRDLPEGIRFVSREGWAAMRSFAADTDAVDVAHNSIRDHKLLRYYEQGWADWYE